MKQFIYGHGLMPQASDNDEAVGVYMKPEEGFCHHCVDVSQDFVKHFSLDW